MVRSRIPGGVLSAVQYLAHDELASRYGNSTLRLTTGKGFSCTAYSRPIYTPQFVRSMTRSYRRSRLAGMSTAM